LLDEAIPLLTTSKMTSLPPQIKVIFFDVFGTCVQQRTPVADELYNATKEALASGRDINATVRSNAEKLVS
jgi:2-haloacid dehalogenase